MEEAVKHAKQDFLETPLEKLSCRLCGGKSLQELGEVNEYVFVECRDCHFAFCPYISQDLMARLYADGYHAKGGNVPEHGWSRLEFLEPALKLFAEGQSLKVLDFGAGQSKVPKKLREQGHKVIAVDVTEPEHPHPDRLTGDLIELALAPNQFDLTYSFQVFEHLSEPVPLFHELLRLTKPGGYVLIHTDMEPPEREEGFSRWWYVLPPDHCSFYKIKSFRRLLEGTSHLLLTEDPKYVIIQKNGKSEN